MDPDNKDGKIDRQDAEHEDENGMDVIIKVVMSSRVLHLLVELRNC